MCPARHPKTGSCALTCRMRYRTFALFLALYTGGALCASQPALDSDVTQATIQQTICQKGYSSTVRPSTTFTNPIKFRLMAQRGIPETEKSEWALDHRVPIALGGPPRKLDNLQLLSQHDNSRKSRIEAKLLCYVCAGQMPLSQAQHDVWEDWEAAYRKYARDKCGR